MTVHLNDILWFYQVDFLNTEYSDSDKWSIIVIFRYKRVTGQYWWYSKPCNFVFVSVEQF